MLHSNWQRISSPLRYFKGACGILKTLMSGISVGILDGALSFYLNLITPIQNAYGAETTILNVIILQTHQICCINTINILSCHGVSKKSLLLINCRSRCTKLCENHDLQHLIKTNLLLIECGKRNQIKASNRCNCCSALVICSHRIILHLIQKEYHSLN